MQKTASLGEESNAGRLGGESWTTSVSDTKLCFGSIFSTLKTESRDS